MLLANTYLYHWLIIPLNLRSGIIEISRQLKVLHPTDECILYYYYNKLIHCIHIAEER